MTDFSADLSESGKPKEPQGLEKVYVNLQPKFASLVFTAPNLQINFPENVSLQSEGELSVALRNNGRFELNRYGDIRGADWTARTTIEVVSWHGEAINGEELLTRRTELLNRFFVEMLGSEEVVRQMRAANEADGLRQDSYLYRAITPKEERKMKRDGSVFWNHLDPSANFESEDMYKGEHSPFECHVSAPAFRYGLTKVIGYIIDASRVAMFSF